MGSQTMLVNESREKVIMVIRIVVTSGDAEKDQNQEYYIENFSCSCKYTFYLSEWFLL